MRGDRTAMSSMAGEQITERLEFDGGRQVTVMSRRLRSRQSCSPVMVS
jgi:hypothetical protein